MIAHRRRRIMLECLRAALLILLTLFLEAGDHFNRVEQVLYDLRAKLCQRHFPPPSNRLVHLDIDDTALSNVGRWPWDRDRLAEILDEIRLAGPKVLAMDVLFAEPSPIRYDRDGRIIDPDRIFAASLQKFGRALIPASLTFAPPQKISALDRRLAAMLEDNPQLTAEQCAGRLANEGFASPAMQENVGRRYLGVLQNALHERIRRELRTTLESGTRPAVDDASGAREKAAIQQRVLPKEDPQGLYTLLDHLFDDEYRLAVREFALERFTFTAGADLPSPVAAASEIAPLAEFGEAAAFSGFVDYLPDRVGGTVRRVPLLASYRGRLFPQMGFATACAMLGVELRDLKLTPDAILLPRKAGGPIAIPVSRRQQTLIGPAAWLMELPIVDPAESWQTPDRRRDGPVVEHLSVFEVWRICLMRQRMERNEQYAARTLLDVLRADDPDAAARFQSHPPTPSERRALMAQTIEGKHQIVASLEAIGNLDDAAKKEVSDSKKVESDLREILKQNDAETQQLAAFRADLAMKLKDKAAFLGGTATGHVDVVPTSLYFACPGVVVHGAVFNAILSGKMWRVAPGFVNLLLIAGIGGLTAFFILVLSPLRIFLATGGLVLAYILINGLVLFDSCNLIVGLSGPIFAAILVYSAATLFNFITEVLERNRITRRFSNYVDPKLVNYVIEHPEQARFDGETREMTMGFTDLAGFTTFTETLGPRTVPLLAEYMGKMIPTIRANKGYVARLMGDGIYFFFNAPGADADHAAHAIGTVLAMHQAIEELNLTLPARGYPVLSMRAGLCTGEVIVGDAGSAEFSDYTALGDAVNTAARLETANKFFGTKVLASQRTIDLLDNQFLCRPIANLRVAGKSKGILVYEPLCRANGATPQQRRLTDLSRCIFETFGAGQFDACIKTIDELQQFIGESVFGDLYRKLALEYRVSPPRSFDGEIILSEK